MKLHIQLFLVSFSIIFSLQAKNVVIKGTAKGFAGKEIKAWKYTDYITHAKKQIGIGLIGKNEKFTINLNIAHTQYIKLQIEDKSTGIYVAPGKVYNVYLWYDPQANETHIYDRFLDISFPFPQPGNINLLVSIANMKLDEYITDNKPYIQKQDRLRMAKSFIDFEKSMLSNKVFQENNYIKNYVLYSVAAMEAALEIIVRPHPDEKRKPSDAFLFEKYIKNRPVLFYNKTYMGFLQQIYNQRFNDMRLEKGTVMNGAISLGWSYKKIASYLKKQEIFSNDTILEIFMLNGIDNDYHNQYVNKKNMMALLKQIEAHPVCKETGTLAKDVYAHLIKDNLSSGIKAPDFSLPDVDSNMVTLRSFRGKYVYLQFWAAWSTPSVREMLVIKKYKKEYGKKIAFVSICAGGTLRKMRDFLKQYPFKWTFLHYNYNSKLLSSYFVYTIPTYILINPEGNIVSAPAARPAGNVMHPGDENIEKVFYAIMHGKKL